MAKKFDWVQFLMVSVVGPVVVSCATAAILTTIQTESIAKQLQEVTLRVVIQQNGPAVVQEVVRQATSAPVSTESVTVSQPSAASTQPSVVKGPAAARKAEADLTSATLKAIADQFDQNQRVDLERRARVLSRRYLEQSQSQIQDFDDVKQEWAAEEKQWQDQDQDQVQTQDP